MAEYYDRESIQKILSSKNWISPHKKVVAVVDRDAGVAELIEDHARGTCLGGSAWSLYHYTKNSKSVFWSKREGARLFYKLKISEKTAPAKLEPSYRPACIESLVLEGGKVKVTYSGLAGAGVAALSRGMAEGVEGVEVQEWGGGKKLGRATLVLPMKEKVIIGVDDTDKPDEGATWSLVNEIACEVSKRKGVDYLEHAIVQLYPQNPFKTQNCVSLGVSFAVPPEIRDEVVGEFREAVASRTLSSETSMAWFSGVCVPENLKAYSMRAKCGMVTIEDAEEAAGENKVKIFRITGPRGIIGAVAAIPYVELPDEAVKMPGELEPKAAVLRQAEAPEKVPSERQLGMG
jgi:methanogenesis imperfect marker protein 11